MQRRSFVDLGARAALGLALGGCASGRSVSARGRQYAALAPVHVTAGRVIRMTVGLRPHRPSGFVVRAERLDDRLLIHNYGHGGAGMSLAWGTAQLAVEHALQHEARTAAVIGCGVAGLTSARLLQRNGFAVTVYAAALPPHTTSNVSWASFTPLSGLVAFDRRTPEWDAQFRRATEIAYHELQLLVGRGYGVSWLDEYAPTNEITPAVSGSVEAGRNAAEGVAASARLLPPAVTVGHELLGPGEHPFPTRYARVRPTLRFEPSIYLDALLRDVLLFGGRVVVRQFDTPHDLMSVSEQIIVNCTGLGSYQLFGDTELVPIKGQLVVLVPQPEVNYMVSGMMPRSDGIVLGHTMERGVWSLDVNETERARVLERHAQLFSRMRPLS